VTGIRSSSAKGQACEAVALADERVEVVHIFAKLDAARTGRGVVREAGASSPGVTVFQTANSGCMRVEADLFGIQDARRWSERRSGVHTGAEFDADVALEVRCLWQVKENRRDLARMAFQVAVEGCPAIAAVEVGGVQSGKRGDSRLEKAAWAYLEDMPVAGRPNRWHCSGYKPSGEAGVGSGHLRHPTVVEHAVAARCPLARSRTQVWSLFELQGYHSIFCPA
jgi:hypothetical protein